MEKINQLRLEGRKMPPSMMTKLSPTACGEAIFNKTGNDDMMNLSFVGEE